MSSQKYFFNWQHIKLIVIALISIVFWSDSNIVYANNVSNIVKIQNLSSFKAVVENIDQDTLVVFDIDDVIFTAKDQILKSYNKEYNYKMAQEIQNRVSEQEAETLWGIILETSDYKIVDASIIGLIKNLQDKHIKVLGLTNVLTGSLGRVASIEDWDIKRLKKNKINFEKSWARVKEMSFKNILSTKKPGRFPVFKQGVLFTSGASKGEVLKSFLMQIKMKPKKIIFIDDKLKNIEDMKKYAASEGIDFLGFEYTAVRDLETTPLNEEHARCQLDTLENQHKWLSDKEIDSLMAQNYCTKKSANAETNSREQNEIPYLIKPTGTYGIGYDDIFLRNINLCPDVFYKQGINESDFSTDNKQHCHEIALRVYYPSESPIELKDKYYAPYLVARNLWIETNNELSKQDVEKLNTLLSVKTFSSRSANPVKTKKFPVVIFAPGAGTAVQAYNNYISNLVSHGYIVIGVNSFFLNGGIALSNGHVVIPPNSYRDEQGRDENLSDLKFVMSHLKKIALQANLEKEMDLNRIALSGHSRGAMSIVNAMKEDKNKLIKAIILLDPGNLLKEKNYPIPNLNIPTMIIWSSKFKEDMHGSVLVGENNFEVVLKGKNSQETYSDHLNFSDDSTLQYHPAYQISTVEKVPVGTGNGYEIASEINKYSLEFLNTYLKLNADS